MTLVTHPGLIPARMIIPSTPNLGVFSELSKLCRCRCSKQPFPKIFTSVLIPRQRFFWDCHAGITKIFQKYQHFLGAFTSKFPIPFNFKASSRTLKKNSGLFYGVLLPKMTNPNHWKLWNILINTDTRWPKPRNLKNLHFEKIRGGF